MDTVNFPENAQQRRGYGTMQIRAKINKDQSLYMYPGPNLHVSINQLVIRLVLLIYRSHQSAIIN